MYCIDIFMDVNIKKKRKYMGWKEDVKMLQFLSMFNQLNYFNLEKSLKLHCDF